MKITSHLNDRYKRCIVTHVSNWRHSGHNYYHPIGFFHIDFIHFLFPCQRCGNHCNIPSISLLAKAINFVNKQNRICRMPNDRKHVNRKVEKGKKQCTHPKAMACRRTICWLVVSLLNTNWALHLEEESTQCLQLGMWHYQTKITLLIQDMSGWLWSLMYESRGTSDHL
jgi:hypothetical protein